VANPVNQLFRRLFKRRPWWDLAENDDPPVELDSRRITRTSASPLNKVLIKPAVFTPGKQPSPVDRVLRKEDLDVADVAFNPYNTGAFDRASSWDKISRQKKR
jgi:hypothetical protein